MTQIKYCLTKSTQSPVTRDKIVTKWFRICEQQQKPCIRLHTKGKRANIHWDHLSYSLDMDNLFSGENGDMLRSDILEMFQRIVQEQRDANMTCMAARDTADFECIPDSIATNLAAELHDLIVRHVKRFT